MEKLAFLLHFYQPVTQEEKTLREIADSSYIPLLKLIKNKTNCKFTLNLPLSLLEQMDKYGYHKWLSDIKTLVDTESVELVSSSAYHYLLTKFSDEVVNDQIILNEFGLGYYFGRRSGFEGEKAIMIKDLKGFFPPEMAVNSRVHKMLEDFGYSWVLVNSSSTGGEHGAFRINDKDCLILARNQPLSDYIAFSRGVEVGGIIFVMTGEPDSVVAMDAETFGHHNPDGIYLLNRLIDAMQDKGMEIVGASELVENQMSESGVRSLDEIVESTWATPNNSEAPAYRLWEGTAIQDSLWDLAKVFAVEAESFKLDQTYDEFENVPFWKKQVSEEVETQLIFSKVFHSDQFWWASGVKVGNNVLYNERMIKSALDIYENLVKRLKSEDLKKLFNDKKQEIEKEITEYEDSNTTSLLSTP